MKNILAFFLLITFHLIQAQNDSEVDSLLAIYNNIQVADTTRIDAIDQVVTHYLYNDLEKAQIYTIEQMELSQKNNYSLGLAMTHFNFAAIHDLSNELDSADFYYEKANEYYLSVGDKYMIATCRSGLANIAFQRGAYEESIQILEESLAQDTFNLFGTNNEFIGRTRLAQGYIQLALRRQLTALSYFERENDESKIADVLVELSNIELELENFQKAVNYSKRARSLYQKVNETYFLGLATLNLGTAYYNLEDYPNALEYYEEGLQIAIETGGRSLEAYGYNSIGKVKQEQGDFEEANIYFKKSRVILEEIERYDQLAQSLNSTAENYLKFDQPIQAISFLDRAISLKDSVDAQIKLERSYFLRAEAYEKIGNYSKSLNDFKNYQSLSDTILNETKSQQIEELRILHDIEQKEKEIVLLAKNAELEKLKATRLWISLVAIFGLASVLLWAQWQRRRKEKLLHQKAQEVELEKRKVAELENQKLNRELDFKKQELTSKVLQLCRKNEFLQSLNQEVKNFKTEVKGVDKTRLEKLSRKINRDMDADEDWANFLKSFESIHPDFKKLLRQKHPNLAPNEIRLAYLMRMNLESKDIANLLNITPDGVKKARYRMRKKMEQDSSVNLTEYFMNLAR